MTLDNSTLTAALIVGVIVYVVIQLRKIRGERERAKALEDDLAKKLSAIFSPGGSEGPELDITPPAGVSDVVDATTARDAASAEADAAAARELASAQADAKAIANLVAQPKEKPWLERWGVAVILGVLAAGAAFGGDFLSFIRSDPPDCTAYANTLLAIHRQAPSNAAAVNAVNAFTWSSLDEQCGPAADFITPLGDPPPPSSP